MEAAETEDEQPPMIRQRAKTTGRMSALAPDDEFMQSASQRFNAGERRMSAPVLTPSGAGLASLLLHADSDEAPHRATLARSTSLPHGTIQMEQKYAMDPAAWLFDAVTSRPQDARIPEDQVLVSRKDLHRLRASYFKAKFSNRNQHHRHMAQLTSIQLEERIRGMTRNLVDSPDANSLTSGGVSYEDESVDYVRHLTIAGPHTALGKQRRASVSTDGTTGGLADLEEVANEDFVEQQTIAGEGENEDETHMARLCRVVRMAEASHCFGSARFDILDCETTSSNTIAFVGGPIFEALDLFTTFTIPYEAVLNFFSKVDSAYRHVPYHNSMHGADVAHTVFYLLNVAKLGKKLHAWQNFAAVVAAMCHDIGHFGLTNNFLMATNHEQALFHSYSSPLERMHLSRAFHILNEPDSNIFANVPSDQLADMRHLMVDMILATDMSNHAVHMGQLQHLNESSEKIELNAEADCATSSFVLQMALHCADLGNPTKPFPVAYRWTKMVLHEFHAQGDRERELGLPISPGFDRTNFNNKKKATGQLFFTGVLVLPLWRTFAETILKTTGETAVMDVIVGQIETNMDEWKKLINVCETQSARKITRLLSKSRRMLMKQAEGE